MACTALTISRKLPCGSPMKGIKAVSFGIYNVSDLVVAASGLVTALPDVFTDAASLARFEVKATANVFVETSTMDEATRTHEVVGALTVAIPGNDVALKLMVEKLTGSLWVVFIEDYNGKIHVAGSQNGADVQTSVLSSDTQGFTLTIGTREREFKYELSGAGLTDYSTAILPYV